MQGLIMKYFVLKPEGQDAYAKASRAAMKTYAENINNTNPQLAVALVKWAWKEEEVPCEVSL